MTPNSTTNILIDWNYGKMLSLIFSLIYAGSIGQVYFWKRKQTHFKFSHKVGEFILKNLSCQDIARSLGCDLCVVFAVINCTQSEPGNQVAVEESTKRTC